MNLAVLVHDPPPGSVADDALVAGLRGRAVLDLDVDALGLSPGEQLLLERSQ